MKHSVFTRGIGVHPGGLLEPVGAVLLRPDRLDVAVGEGDGVVEAEAEVGGVDRALAVAEEADTGEADVLLLELDGDAERKNILDV